MPLATHLETKLVVGSIDRGEIGRFYRTTNLLFSKQSIHAVVFPLTA